jgi:hypothetical protein
MLKDMDDFFRLYLDLPPGPSEGTSPPPVATGPLTIPRDVAE